MMMKIVVNQLKQNQTQEKKSIIKKAGKGKHIRKLSPVKMMKTQLIKDCLDLVNLIALSINVRLYLLYHLIILKLQLFKNITNFLKFLNLYKA